MDRQMRIVMIVCFVVSGVLGILLGFSITESYFHLIIPTFIGTVGFIMAGLVALRIGRQMQRHLERKETDEEFTERKDWTWKASLLLIERSNLGRKDAEKLAADLWKWRTDETPEQAVDRWIGR